MYPIVGGPTSQIQVRAFRIDIASQSIKNQQRKTNSHSPRRRRLHSCPDAKNSPIGYENMSKDFEDP